MDDFLHQHVLAGMKSLKSKALERFLDQAEKEQDLVCLALGAECLLLRRGREALLKRFPESALHALSEHTPLIHLRSVLEPDQALHSQWTAIFKRNIENHEPLPLLANTGLPHLSFKTETAASGTAVLIADLAGSAVCNGYSSSPIIPPSQMADIAAERLENAGVALGPLMRHEASLSPIGLLRSWRFRTRTDNGRNRFSLSGEQISYGRGLSPDTARASLMMEIVERYSAFASVSGGGLESYRTPYPFRRASYKALADEIAANGDESGVLDPDTLALEVSYRGQPLHWVCGEAPGPEGSGRHQPFWVPVQCLFLFCNLDEPALFSGLGSTGLASGATPAQARLAALLEIIERHQAATVPYDPAACFKLVALHDPIAGLLETYRRAGIHLWFQDITPAFGVPCCRCFVTEQSGTIHIGTAAHLDARRAIIAAITETGCPFPHSPATRPGPPESLIVDYERLPDYSTGHGDADVALLENLLVRNHYRPCYVDLTRTDVNLPVVKAMVPGMEIMGDFDDCSRVHPDLFGRYLARFR